MHFDELFETFKIVAVRSKQRLEDNISILYHYSINLLANRYLESRSETYRKFFLVLLRRLELRSLELKRIVY